MYNSVEDVVNFTRNKPKNTGLVTYYNGFFYGASSLTLWSCVNYSIINLSLV